MGFFYRGRHRKPTDTTRRAATIATTGAIGLGVATGSATAAEGPNWGPIIACESGGNPRAQNPSSSASGLYQFIDGTWRAYGGLEFAPRAKDATPAEQTIVANRAFAREGYTPWNASKACWGSKINTPTAPVIRSTGAPPRATPAKPVKPQTTKPVKPRATPAQPATPAQHDDPPGLHLVRPGDTLSHIAVAHQVEGGWQALYEDNREVVGADPDLIFPGQQLDLDK